jgi:hypothetical protein
MTLRRLALTALVCLSALPLFAQADLSVLSPSLYVHADPGAPFTHNFAYINQSSESAVQVELTVDLPAGSTFLRGSYGCTATGTRVVCAAGDLPGHDQASVNVEFVTPAEFAGVELPLAYAVRHAGTDPRSDNNGFATGLRLYRTFVVDSVEDDGPGSLRQAITSANAARCDTDERCRITFRFAPREGTAWYTIRPLSPLPALTANYTGVNGEIQTWLTGDTNPAGPEIELNGSLAGGGNGLLIDSVGDMVVRGLVINGWAENGISFVHVGRDAAEFLYLNTRLIMNNYIGTDPTGSFAVPNGLRGIASSGGSGQIANNVISGNARSGIYFWGPGGATYSHSDAAIVRNRIGVKAGSDEPLPNGMAGIFLGPDALGIDVTDNVIGYNLHFGVAVANVTENRILRNRIFGHDIAAIDIGIDGPTAVAPHQYSPVPVAVLTSAVYDAANNVTRVEGHPFIAPTFGYNIELFSSAVGRADADQYLGTSEHTHDKAFFSMAVPGDLRGKAITATLTRVRSYGFLGGPRTNETWQGIESQTSELSAPIEVK